MKKGSMSVGGASLILIFAVLCFSTFGMLSLLAAQSDMRLAQKSASAAAAYYQADCLAEEWYRQVMERAAPVYTGDTDAYYLSLAAEFPEEFSEGAISKEFEINENQSLHTALAPALEGGAWHVIEWRVVTKTEEIDTSLPVWQ